MSDTKPDVQLSSTEYTDVYSATGIAVGSPLIIQNKKAIAVYVQVSPTKPDRSSLDGCIIAANDFCTVVGKISKVWALGASRISVQEIDE